MTNPSPTDLEEISALLAEAQAEAVKWNACCAALRAAILKYIKSNFTTATAGKAERELLEVGTLFYKDAGQNLLTHIAALEAERDHARTGWHECMRCLADKAVDAQLATRLTSLSPQQQLVINSAKERRQKSSLSGLEENLLSVIERLLSGAATPAPTAALTEEER